MVQAGGGRLRLPALVVGLALQREVLRLGRVEQERQQAVAGAQLVHGGGAVANPLPRHEHRHRAVELELHHLAGRGVGMALQIAHQAPGLAHLPGAGAVAHPGGALDGGIGTHVVHQRHEAVVQHGEVAAEYLLGGGNRLALGVHGGDCSQSNGLPCA